MRRVSRDLTGEPVIAEAPEKIADAIEDLVTAVERALVEDGVECIGLETKTRWLAETVTHIVTGFASDRVKEFEEWIDEQLRINALIDGAEVDAAKRGRARGGVS